MEGKSCFTSLLSFYDQVTHLVDEGKSVDVDSLDFSKAFDFSLTQYCLGEVGSPWLEQAYSLLCKNLAGWSGPENGGEYS